MGSAQRTAPCPGRVGLRQKAAAVLMPGDYDLALRQADAARADFAAIGDELEFIRIQLSALPTRQELVRTALLAGLAGAALATGLALVLWR